MELAVRTFGDGGGSVLLLHGLGSNSNGWWRVGPALAEAGYRVTAPDLRGHGESDHVDDYSLSSYAADVESLADSWTAVIGHSLGGSVAIKLFERNPAFGEKLVLVDPALILPAPEIAIEALIAPYDGPLTAARVSADNPTWHSEDARIKAEALQQSAATVTLMTVRHNPAWNLVEAAAHLAVPTLLVGADPDIGALVPPALGSGLAEINEQIRFLTIAGSSHSIHRDEFAPLMNHVVSFLG